MSYRCFDNLSEGIVLLDQEKKILYFNSPARVLEELTHIKLQSGISIEVLLNGQNIEFHIETGTFSQASLPAPPANPILFRNSKGQEVSLEIAITPFIHESISGKWFMIIRNLSDQKSFRDLYREEIEKKEKAVQELHDVQDQLTQFSKAAIIGQFIASITHELNNPLTYLLSSVEDLSGVFNEDDFDLKAAKTLTENVSKGAFRILQITNHLKTFLHSPLSSDNLVYTDLYSIIEKAVNFTHHITLKNKITVKNQIPKDLPRTLVDPSLIEQVAINLIRNSVDALLESKKAENQILEIFGKFNQRTQSITLSFIDHGPGISKETMNKLFTPFFTTKAVGKGTGLGLTICSSIAEKHEGTLTVSETPGGGATFYLTLPVRSSSNETSNP